MTTTLSASAASPRAAPELSVRARQAWGAATLVALALHAIGKAQLGVLPEMLWACHVASLLVGFGLIAGLPRIVTAGFLFHAAIGLPAYALDVAANHSTTWTSVLTHLTTPLAGAMLVRTTGLRWRTVLEAWAFFAAMQVLAYVATAPALNVNLAHAPWPNTAAIFPPPYVFRIVNLASAGALLSLAAFLVRLVLARRTVEASS